jgi:hypothetical protein
LLLPYLLNTCLYSQLFIALPIDHTMTSNIHYRSRY